MALVKIKEKYQVTIPTTLCQKAGLEVGDLLEARVEGNKLTFTPKSVIDRDIAISLKQVREGKVSPPYRSAKAFLRALHRDVRRLKKNP